MLEKMDNEVDVVVILVSGRAGVGKSTVASAMHKHLQDNGYKSRIDHFAKTIKDIAWDMFSWDGQKDDKGRVLLQKLGAVGREYNQDVWANWLYNRYIIDPVEFLIVDDWRFPNEKAFLEGKVGVKIVTVRVNAPSREILLGTLEYNDVSEISLPEDFYAYDYTIQNQGTLGELGVFGKMITDDLTKTYGIMLTKGEE
jgi:hypothetical protein